MPTTQTVEYFTRADRPRDPDAPTSPALADIARDDFVLFELASTRTILLADLIVNAALDRTIDGASTLKVECLDLQSQLITHPLLRRNPDGLFYARLVVDALVFHLVSVDFAPRRATLGFEAQVYNALRRHDNPLSTSRGKDTRAQFIKHLCTEAKVKLICPELRVKQRIAKEKASTAAGPDQVADAAASDPVTRDTNRQPGFADHAKITVKGAPAGPAQRANLALSLGIASDIGAGPRATLAMVVAGTGEASWNKTAAEQVYGTHVGVFQSNQIPAADLDGQTRHFLQGGKSFAAGGAIGICKAHPTWTPGQVAQAVEISDGSAAYYDQFAAEARRTIAAYTGGSTNLSDSATTGVLAGDTGEYTQAYEFTRGVNGHREDSITCARRLADEVAWYFFESAGKIYFASGPYLLRSRARMLVTPGAAGIESVSFSLDESVKRPDTISVACRAARWQAPPGSTVDVDGYGCADGRWLVGQISRPKMFTSNLTTVTLVAAKRKKLEPAHETKQRPDQTADQTSDSPFSTTQTPGGLAGSGASPKSIIDDVVLPLARKHGIAVTAASVEAANARHGPTVTGGRSDHQGPPEVAWAADMSNGTTTPQEDALADDLARMFHIPWNGSGLSDKTSGTYRYQLIYRTSIGGNHFNHVHFGVRKVGA